jgi:hypothetical protein
LRGSSSAFGADDRLPGSAVSQSSSYHSRVMLLPAAIASASCLATPVHGNTVRAGPFAGVILRRYDVLNGRFRLHVGQYRDARTGLSQKIAWSVPSDAQIGSTLVVTWRLLHAERRSFRDVLQLAGTSTSNRFFPSSFSPQSAGCWRLTFTERKAERRAHRCCK